MADIIVISGAFPANKGTVNDIAVRAVDTNVQENKKRAAQMLHAGVKLGMAYMSNGAPSGAGAVPIACGAFCLDHANDDIYVCVDRSTPTWTKLAE